GSVVSAIIFYDPLGVGDRGDLLSEQALLLPGLGAFLASKRIFVLDLAADSIARRHSVRRLDHGQIYIRPVLAEPGLHGKMPVKIILQQADRLQPASNHYRHFIDDNALRRDGNGLEPRGAEA